MLPKWKEVCPIQWRKISICQVYHRLRWIQNSCTDLIGITQIDIFWLLKSHYSKTTCWDCTRWRIYIHFFQFPSSISDKDITVKSGLLNHQMWEPGEELTADWRLIVEDYLSPLGVKLLISSFLKGWGQFAEEEVIKSQQIINKGIHVERMIQHGEK